ncbi:SGNH/GDSL hydrolase family protein [Aquipuribacter hungaricus]|uniref:SGNH/GDSL hydrolase family protein n=1 Tax=Aquipuribacter hungaricus TaxID=545624 RepID=A0ABV7WE09_9MICO
MAGGADVTGAGGAGGVRLVCLGDSFTEGMSDELRPDGHHRGWADRVAAALARRAADGSDREGGGRGVSDQDGAGDGGVLYANLAVRGKLLDQVVADQVPVALALAPTLLTFHAGPNDVLRRGTDLPGLQRRYDAAVGRLGASGARVLLFTSIGRAGGTGALARSLAARFARFNAGVRDTAARHGALLVDLEPVTVLTDRRVWHTDRLHLAPSGHARVAAAVLERLGVDDPALLGGPPGWWQEPLPPAPATVRRAELAADVAWLRGDALPWVGRRLRGVSSGDGRDPKDPVLRPVALPPAGQVSASPE